MGETSTLKLLFVPAALMVLIGVLSIVLWRVRTRAQWRWFALGAAAWFVAVLLKGTWAYFLNEPVLAGLSARLPRLPYLITGALYTGVQSSLCEIGLILVIALIWTRVASDASRGLAVGFGAGGFEAMMVGLIVGLGVLGALFGGPSTDELRREMLESSAQVPLVWLIGPVERIMAILCHASSRGLVLFAVATRRWRFAAAGFALFTLLDSIAGLVHVAGWAEHPEWMWWIELALLPLALASIPILQWSWRRWPAFMD